MSGALDPRSPVIVGVGQVSHRADRMEDGREPTDLMAEAIRNAAADAGLASVPDVDALRVVSLLSWRYRDPARFIAEQLGVDPGERGYTTNGGNSPQSLVNTTAGQIQRGELDIAILTGGESFRTRMRYRKSGTEPPWPTIAEDVAPDRVLGEELAMSHPGEIALGLYQPVQMYPMFETAIRAGAGRSLDDHYVRISELWARFSEVAATNSNAWLREPKSAEEIRTVGPHNRMIGLPYPKLMNSNNDVDQAAALIVCSAEKATALGIPRDRWVFVHAGTDCHEHAFVSNRWTFAETPAVALGGRLALELAGVGIDDIELIDLYSCFPSAVQLGAQSLGLSLDRQLTRTGGLSFAGGPWNNYVMHAIATVVDELRRADSGSRGLVWANGGYATKHAFGVYSNAPSTGEFRWAKPQDEIDAMPQRVLAEPTEAAGPATIEAYTVVHDRDGAPEKAFAACLLPDGRRAWGVSTEPAAAAAMCVGEWVGQPVALDAEATLRL